METCYRLKDLCSCNELSLDNFKDEEINSRSPKWYQLIDNLIADALLKFPKSARLHLLYAYI